MNKKPTEDRTRYYLVMNMETGEFTLHDTIMAATGHAEALHSQLGKKAVVRVFMRVYDTPLRKP